MVNMPWDQPVYAKKKRKPAKKKAKKRKVAKKAPSRKKATKKRSTKKVARKKAKKRRGRRAVPSARVVVSKVELNKLRKNVARPAWMDQLPKSKRKVFKHKGKTYWPLYSLLYMVDAVEVVPLSQWKGPTTTEEYGALLRPGFVEKVGSKKYVYVLHTQFIQRGSPLDV